MIRLTMERVVRQILLRRLFWKFAPLESLILDATRTVLSDEMGRLLEAQRAYVTSIDRHSLESYFHLYDVLSKRELHFPCAGEIELASLELTHTTTGTTHRARVMAERGRLARILVRPAPKSRRWEDCWTINSITAEDNPAILFTKEMIQARRYRIDPPSGWVAEFLAGCGGATKLSLAFEDKDLAWDRSWIRAALPSDYLEFSAQIGTATLLKRVQIWGISYIREIHFPDADYYILGDDKKRACFAVRRLDQTGDVYLLTGKRKMNCGPSFRNAVETYLAQELKV